MQEPRQQPFQIIPLDLRVPVQLKCALVKHGHDLEFDAHEGMDDVGFEHGMTGTGFRRGQGLSQQPAATAGMRQGQAAVAMQDLEAKHQETSQQRAACTSPVPRQRPDHDLDGLRVFSEGKRIVLPRRRAGWVGGVGVQVHRGQRDDSIAGKGFMLRHQLLLEQLIVSVLGRVKEEGGAQRLRDCSQGGPAHRRRARCGGISITVADELDAPQTRGPGLVTLHPPRSVNMEPSAPSGHLLASG
ncbi:hypothetical protein BP6252_08878 [Coleophoma cylindrospora]|uniref:Uncharacterized protein n=1 Tax=Coleophoma cylindrospora TaxID=1849047 RepID=A0A3D8R7E9_9HELO|nr:hypothetical protein BP6252_08878 [Coleophoma cylindrospora]